MVQIVENWSDLRGRIEAVEQVADASAPLVLRVRVESVQAVSEYPNLLAEAVGKTISICGPAPPKPPEVGKSMRARVRKAGLHQHFYRPGSLVIE